MFLVNDSFGPDGVVDGGVDVAVDVGVDVGVDAEPELDARPELVAGPEVGVVAAAVGRCPVAEADPLTASDGAPGLLMGEQAAAPAPTTTVSTRHESCRARHGGRGGSASGCIR